MSILSRAASTASWFLVAGASASVSAQEIVWKVDGTLYAESFGSSMALLPDFNGDGVRDLLVGALGASGTNDFATARVLSGVDLATLLEVRGGPWRGFGAAVADGGDVDGDGITDLLFGEANESAAHLFSGRDGTLLREWRGGGPGLNDQFGAGVAGMGDLDGDGVGDVAIGAPLALAGGLAVGTVQLFSGSDGALLHEFHGGTDHSTAFGFRNFFANVGDGDGDGVADLGLIDQQPSPVDFAFVVRVVSGATGVERFTVAFNQGLRDGYWLSSIAPFGDWDGDGNDDLLVAGFDSAVANSARAFVLSGADGAELLVVDSPEHGWSNQAASVGDRDGDGKAEIAFSVDYSGAGGKWAAVTLHRGSDGALLGRIDGFIGPPFGPAGAFGKAIVGGIDVDGDGLGDVTISDAALVDAGLRCGVVEQRAWPGGQVVVRRLGERDELRLNGALALLDDVDGDGANDFVAANVSAVDRVRDSLRVRSGRDAASLADHRLGALPDGDLVALPDRDGDGHDDVAIGLATASTAPRVEVRSSADGKLLQTIPGNGKRDGFGRVLAAGVQPNGALQLAVGVPEGGSLEFGAVSVFDVASGALLFQRTGFFPDEALGSSIAWLGDVDGDAIGDWAFGGPGYGSTAQGRVLVVSGSAGATIATLTGTAAGDHFGQRLATLRDLDGDGRAELAIAAPDAGASDAGEVRLVAGGSWLPFWTLAGAAAGDHLGAELVALRDLDGDGADEWAALAVAPRRFDVRSGANGRLLMRFPFYSGGALQRLAAASPWQSGSSNGDGFADLIAHDPASPFGLGSAWLLALDDLMLQIDPPVAFDGDTVHAWLRGGKPRRASVFQLVAVDGVPVHAWFGLGSFDALGESSVLDVVPPGMAGLVYTLQGFGIGLDGSVKDSTPQQLHFE